jgi:hypothetical protein
MSSRQGVAEAHQPELNTRDELGRSALPRRKDWLKMATRANLQDRALTNNGGACAISPELLIRAASSANMARLSPEQQVVASTVGSTGGGRHPIIALPRAQGLAEASPVSPAHRSGRKG